MAYEKNAIYFSSKRNAMLLSDGYGYCEFNVLFFSYFLKFNFTKVEILDGDRVIAMYLLVFTFILRELMKGRSIFVDMLHKMLISDVSK